MNYHKRLIELREKAGLSQQDLADRLNVTRQTVSRWENQKTEPPIDTLVYLSELYGVSVDYLLGRTEFPQQSKEAASERPDTTKPRQKPRWRRILLAVCAAGIVAVLLFCIFRPVRAEPDVTPLEDVPGEVVNFTSEIEFPLH